MTIPITDAREELATSKNPKTNPPKNPVNQKHHPPPKKKPLQLKNNMFYTQIISI